MSATETHPGPGPAAAPAGRLWDRFARYAEYSARQNLVVFGLLVFLIAWLDWKVEPNFSIGFLYVFPILLASGSLARWEIVLLATSCAVLREAFSPWRWQADAGTRIVVSMVVFGVVGLLVGELLRNRRMVLQHLRELQLQTRQREEAERQLRVLIETTPLAVLTLNQHGKVLVANQSAHTLLRRDGQRLAGQDIADYLPILADFLATKPTVEVRTSLQCRGQNQDGEAFFAHVWLSTCASDSGPWLAVVMWDASEDLRDREGSRLEASMTTSRTLMAALAHEVRNLTTAAASLYEALETLPGLPQNKDFQTLRAVLKGLERIATSGLSAGSDRATATANLYAVLDEVRVILEPSFRKAEVQTAWRVAEELPTVQGDHHSLLQVFLNLARNSLRAMPAVGAREFSIEVAVQRGLVLVHVRDTGAGVAEPENLFRPFWSGAGGAGLGLYVSRAILRPYGGDLRYEAQPQGSCFIVEMCPLKE